MNTPICDFVARYMNGQTVRLHMPGHKGIGPLGVEARDITEILGADVLYHPRGVIRQSEDNAACLFGAARTVYSAEGSSLCIRAMVRLALLDAKEKGRAPLILAGRNAHKAFLSAAALLDADVRWLYPEHENSLIACDLSAACLDRTLQSMDEKPAAVYVTSPDYLGHLCDVAGMAAVCRRHRVPLLVDNAHGAYLKFLPQDGHPITLGADMCCDSAHKTLPVLTGGAYLHIAKSAPAVFARRADEAMALFASTSPSYLILQSLDACNAVLAGDYRGRLAACAQRVEALKARLSDKGFSVIGEEPLKIALAPKPFGYTGDALHDRLRRAGAECEFSDPDHLVMMVSADTPPEDMERAAAALLNAPRLPAIEEQPPCPPRPNRKTSIRRAMLGLQKEVPVDQALGRVLGDAYMGCPPAVPILIPGEEIDEEALRCLRYYGTDTVSVLDE